MLRKVARCLVPGGYPCLREPSVSMGDWRRPRGGLARRESGIPSCVFRRALMDTRLETLTENRWIFGPMGKAGRLLRRWLPIYANDSRLLVGVDALLCRIFSSNTTYHTENPILQFRPTAVAFVVRKALG